MALSADERALVERIHADLDADEPRLAYAGWLHQQGDPRGEFMRLDIEWRRMEAEDPRFAALDARRQQLLGQHYAGWIQPLLDLGLRLRLHGVDTIYYTRGLAEELMVDRKGIFPEQA